MKLRPMLFLSAAFLLLYACSKKSSTDTASILNPWDGKYRIEGTLTDAVNATYANPGPKEYLLETSSPTQIKLISKDLGIPGHLISVGGSLSYYSQFALIVNFDPATNKITGVSNSYGQPSANGRTAVLDPSGVNTWDPVTKNIKIKYWLDETGVAGHRGSFNETWFYIGAR
ncbi:MAG TPA: hypothetical protein PKC54_15475 [Ferruginibacter sp.]|nr:hypothetical protein [Ferruginibacter sp.]